MQLRDPEHRRTWSDCASQVLCSSHTGGRALLARSSQFPPNPPPSHCITWPKGAGPAAESEETQKGPQDSAPVMSPQCVLQTPNMLPLSLPQRAAPGGSTLPAACGGPSVLKGVSFWTRYHSVPPHFGLNSWQVPRPQG